MKPGDLVRNKQNKTTVKLGLFIGLRVFDGKYECAEVMWFDERAPNGDRISTIQKDLLEIV
tara:strand:- start:136 stop:318 length:183 start_codon:yes stop_codon:yes gene_type:complete